MSLTDDTIKLSKILSRNHLTHSIRNFYEEFNPRTYNNLEHRNLYMLDLDCDYASDVLRQVASVLIQNVVKLSEYFNKIK